MSVKLRSNEYIGAEEYGERKSGTPGSSVRAKLKAKIIKEDILEYKCDVCGLTEWRGEAISLILDHRNGNSRDHRISNLRFICPNCDSQQETFSYRNVGRWKFD